MSKFLRKDEPRAALPSSLEYFSHLRWIDGRPLLDTIEGYRREIFARALDTFRPDGVPKYNFVLCGRGKKNWKSADLVLAALYCLDIRESVGGQGNDCFILANDEDQAGDDLGLAKKLVLANPDLQDTMEVLRIEIRRRDGRGSLHILPATNVIGQHGKTCAFLGIDEIHGFKTHDLLEALAPDPTRPGTLLWICSYDTVFNSPGVPLVDFKAIGKAGSDPRMLFSWYSGVDCTDPAFADLEPELRANPSIASWPEGRSYLDQQRRRLPTHKFRRLHLNLPGSPNGAFLDQGAVLAAIVAGRKVLPPEEGIRYHAFVDMSGGSIDDAVLSIAHKVGRIAVVDLVVKQDGEPPFNPRNAVRKFAAILKSYGVRSVTGDNYAGNTFKSDFEVEGIRYHPSSRISGMPLSDQSRASHTSAPLAKTDLYEAFEPPLNAGEIELPEKPEKLTEQLLTLVVRGVHVDHQVGGHDDFANAVCGAVYLVLAPAYVAPQPYFGSYGSSLKPGEVWFNGSRHVGGDVPGQPDSMIYPPTSDGLRSMIAAISAQK
jgi:hypothetical protein